MKVNFCLLRGGKRWFMFIKHQTATDCFGSNVICTLRSSPQVFNVSLWHYHGGEPGGGVSTFTLRLSPLTLNWTHLFFCGKWRWTSWTCVYRSSGGPPGSSLVEWIFWKLMMLLNCLFIFYVTADLLYSNNQHLFWTHHHLALHRFSGQAVKNQNWKNKMSLCLRLYDYGFTQLKTGTTSKTKITVLLWCFILLWLEWTQHQNRIE